MDRFTTQDLTRQNVEDLQGSITKGELVAVIDSESGGIIAYVLGLPVSDREDEVLALLNT